MSEKTLPGLPDPEPTKSLYVVSFDDRLDQLITTMMGGQYEYQELLYMRARLLQVTASVNDQINEADKFFDEKKRAAGEHVEDREALGSADLSNATVMKVSVGTNENGEVESFTHEEVSNPQGKH